LVRIQDELRMFGRRHGLDRAKLTTYFAQLDETLQRLFKFQHEPTTLTVTRETSAILLDWLTYLRLPSGEARVPGADRRVTPSPTQSHGVTKVRAAGMRFTDEPSLQVIHLERPHPRETMCGDMAMIARKEGRLRVAIADGLGHGPQAREAADVTTRWLRASAKESLEEAVLVAHENTAATRGSTLGIAELDLKTQTVTATTIGNVRVGIYQNTGRVWSPCGTDAVLGHGRGSFHGKLEIRVEKFQLPPGGLLILFSDGLSSQLRLPLSRPQALEELSAQLFASYLVPTDDASLLIVSNSR
jgi:hypothetical protein